MINLNAYLFTFFCNLFLKKCFFRDLIQFYSSHQPSNITPLCLQRGAGGESDNIQSTKLSIFYPGNICLTIH